MQINYRERREKYSQGGWERDKHTDKSTLREVEEGSYREAYISNLGKWECFNSPELGWRSVTLGTSTCCTRSVTVSFTAAGVSVGAAGVSVGAKGAAGAATAAGLACVITVVAAVSQAELLPFVEDCGSVRVAAAAPVVCFRVGDVELQDESL